jgi:N-acetylneuraminic acid mutarotase
LLARRPLGRTLRLFFIAALLVVAAGTAPAGPTRAEEPVPGDGVSPEGLLNADGTLDLATGFQGTLDLRGWEVTLDGERGPVLEPATVSAASAPAWGALPNGGLNGTVYALAVMGDDLYVGGTFTQTVDGAVSDLGNIARYDTASDTWHALPKNGLNNTVRALAVVGSDLYVGGQFTASGDGMVSDLGRIARYDTAGGGTWHALPREGLSSWVTALAVVGSDLYVGGLFTQTGDVTPLDLKRIARYDITGGTWHALPNDGLSNYANALVVVGDDLYVGGAFTASGDTTVTGLNRIARYDITGGAWHALPNDGLNGTVYALTAMGDDLYVGGNFAQTVDATVTGLGDIARYDTTGGTWHALPDGGLDGVVRALAVMGDDLYVGGVFTETAVGGLTNHLNRIARYDTKAVTWNALSNQGLSSTVFSLAVVGDDLYVGGAFTATGDGTVTDLGSVARYDTTTIAWRGLPSQGLDGTVYALAVMGDDLYVGGFFTQSGDGTVSDLGNVARYDTAGGTWHALPKQGLDNAVGVLAVVGDDLYVGGAFTATGDGTVSDLNRIARYDITDGTWHALPNQGLNDVVVALAVVGDDLYVGGDFTATGDGTMIDLGNVARYDITDGTWHALSSEGLSGWVNELAVVGDDLYVGGNLFQTGDGALLNLGNIARYDIAAGTWHALPREGLNDYVHALAVMGDDLYVGGDFTASGNGTLINLGHIERYDTTAIAWRDLSNQGLSGAVHALAVMGDDLYVGGNFVCTGDGTVSDLWEIARYDTAGETWHALPNRGLYGEVRALAVVGDDLYVGGIFVRTGDWTVTSLGYIARYTLYPYKVYLPLVIRQ